jgi:hypothetical protein
MRNKDACAIFESPPSRINPIGFLTSKIDSLRFRLTDTLSILKLEKAPRKNFAIQGGGMSHT